jgi:hypothetical protein
MSKPARTEIFQIIKVLENLKNNALKVRKYNQNDYLSYGSQINLLTKCLLNNNVDSWDYINNRNKELFQCAYWLEKGNDESEYFKDLVNTSVIYD